MQRSADQVRHLPRDSPRLGFRFSYEARGLGLTVFPLANLTSPWIYQRCYRARRLGRHQPGHDAGRVEKAADAFQGRDHADEGVGGDLWPKPTKQIVERIVERRPEE